MTDQLKQLLHENFEYSMTNVHTCFPGVVEKYDPKTRRADIQPSLKRRMPDDKFMAFPIIPDVPVQFFGTKNCTIHVPLEKGDEVSVHVIERSTDKWRDAGGSGIEDTDPRRFDLQDCYAVPGLQPIDFPKTPETGLSILYKDKHKILIDDDNITISIDGKNVLEMSGPVVLKAEGSDLLEIGNAVATLGELFDDMCTALKVLHTEGSPAAHTASVWANANITPLQTKAAQVLKK